jgi:hypothetical protein
LSSELDSELLDNVGDVRANRSKRLFNPEPLKRTALPESYIEKDLDLHVHFGIRAGGGESVTRHYCAVFDNPDGSLVEGPPFAVPPLPDIESGSFGAFVR